MKKIFVFLIFSLLLFSNDLNNHINFSLSRLGSPSLDPHSVQGDLELNINPNIFDGLYKIEPSSGKLVPALAKSYKWINPKVIEFDLRKDVLFHNGEVFDATSVKFSFERMKKVQNGFNWINAIIPQYKKVEIINDYKVRIHFKEHNSIFLISSRFFIMLPPKYLKKHGSKYFKKYPVGTGAFYVDKILYNKDDISTIKLKKFENYWKKDLPKLSSVDYHFNLSQKQSFEKIQNKSLDAMADIPIRSLLSVKKSGLDLQKKGQGLLTWLYFNLTKYKKDSIIYDKNFRQAILYAIDYEKIKKLIYKNHAKVNNQWAFPSLPGYSKNLENYTYDIKKAKELLLKSSYKKENILHMYSDDISLDEAKIIKSSLKRIGVSLSIDIIDEATNNCILTAKNNPKSPCHEKLKYYDFMIGDFSWGLPHNYVSALHTFSQKSFASLLNKDEKSAKISTKMFKEAINNFKNSEVSWSEITEFEYKRLGISGLFLKDTFYAKPKNLKWRVYGAYDFSLAEIK